MEIKENNCNGDKEALNDMPENNKISKTRLDEKINQGFTP